ncbi:unnamed protein product [Lasius platythorax]|uniref:Uncharacterized protein n=1 Tax=Lasius platythorax TaxID=488582 RepID=A0AAV2MX36_9HYME
MWSQLSSFPFSVHRAQRASFVHLAILWPFSPHLMQYLVRSILLLHFEERCPKCQHLKHLVGLLTSLMRHLTQPMRILPPSPMILRAVSAESLTEAIWVSPYAFRRDLTASTDIALSSPAAFLSAFATSSLVAVSSRSLISRSTCYTLLTTSASSLRASAISFRSSSALSALFLSRTIRSCPVFVRRTLSTLSPICLLEASSLIFRSMSA